MCCCTVVVVVVVVVGIVVVNPILTLEMRPNILFEHSKSYFDIQNWAICTKIYFDILNWSKYCFFTFLILHLGQILLLFFLFSTQDQISHFHNQNSGLCRMSLFLIQNFYFDIQIETKCHFYIQNRILSFRIRTNIAFLHSKSYFDMRIGALYVFELSKLIFLHLKLGQILHFDIQNPILIL